MKDKMTHAQKFLFEMINTRTLKIWCEEKGVPYLTCYKIAIGTSVPTYAAICQLLPFIPVTDWFFYENEKIPFERKILEEWNPDEISSFVRRHKHDYMDMASRYDTTENYARNLFVNHRARPTLTFIRACAKDGINPVEFFTSGDIMDDGKFYPERGDIVNVSGKTILVLTKEKLNRETHSFTGLSCEDGIVDYNSLTTFRYARSIPVLVDKSSEETVSEALKYVKKLFNM